MGISDFAEKFFGIKLKGFQKEILEKKNLKISVMPQRGGIVPVWFDPRLDDLGKLKKYKTQVFTEQQLKDLVAGKKAVTAESVKKGEIDSHYNSIKDLVSEEIQGIRNKEGKRIIQVGEVVQALNEKGEKQWYCSVCGNIAKVIIKSDNSICCGVSLTKKGKKIARQTLEKEFEPLLVQLNKIEKKTCPKESTTRYDDMWLKTWRSNNA